MSTYTDEAGGSALSGALARTDAAAAERVGGSYIGLARGRPSAAELGGAAVSTALETAGDIKSRTPTVKGTLDDVEKCLLDVRRRVSDIADLVMGGNPKVVADEPAGSASCLVVRLVQSRGVLGGVLSDLSVIAAALGLVEG